MAESGLVTVLFTDLVGSTELSGRIGDAAADELRRRHFESLRAVIAETGGDEVKTIGDAVMVTYRGAADAIAGAVGMQQAVDRDNRAGGEPLAMRVGISAGDCTFEDGDWFGRPVVEASRLCAEADGGQILVAGIVKVLAGSRAGHELVAVGALELKGLSEPVDAAEVRWEPETGDGAVGDLTVPLPVQLARVDAFSFVGRDDEAESVLTAWKEVATGGRRTVLITGEPGIGKTRLTSEVARTAHDQGAVVLWGGCEEELGIPYQPVAEALAHLVRSVPAEQLKLLLGPLGGELARLLPDLPHLVPGLDDPVTGDADTERYRLFEAVVDVLANLSAEQPVVLVLDDLHWGGKPTLLLLLHLLRATVPLRLLVLVTYRDTDLDRRHPLAEALADLRRMPDVERVALSGLDASGVTAFMEAAAGHQLEQDGVALAEALQQETEGNPFFVGEVLLHLVESGTLVQRDGRWGSDLGLGEVGLPEGVKEVVGRRLSRLSEATNDVLTVAAVIGREFDLSLLGAVHEGGQDAVLEAIEPAEAAGLVRATGDRVGRYTFDHALVRSTLVDELSTSRRLRLHRDIGRAIEGRGDPDGHLAELARHFAECATLGEVERAVDYGRRAAARATADLAYEEAATHLEQALSALELAEPPDPVARCDLLLAMGEAWLYANDHRCRPTLFAAADAARALADVERLAAAAIRLSSRSFARRGLDTDVAPEMTLLEEVLGLLADEDTGFRARALMAQAGNEAHLGGDQERRHALADEALAMARRLGDPEVLCDVLADNWAAWHDTSRPGWLDDALADQDELVALATGRDESLLCRALLFRSAAHRTRGDRAEADLDLAAAEALADRLREPAMTWWCRYERTAADLLRGRYAAAEPAIVATAAYAEQHGIDGSVVLSAQFFRLRFDQGRLLEFEDTIVDRVAHQPRFILWRTALAAIYIETDRPELARPHVEFVGEDDFARVVTGQTWLLTVAATGAVAGLTGQLEITEWAYARALPFAGQLCWTANSYERPVDLHLARMAWALGRYDDAEAHCVACIDLCERAGARPFLGQTKETWAGILLDRGGDADRARQLASEALAIAEELGMARLAEIATRHLTALG